MNENFKKKMKEWIEEDGNGNGNTAVVVVVNGFCVMNLQEKKKKEKNEMNKMRENANFSKSSIYL